MTQILGQTKKETMTLSMRPREYHGTIPEREMPILQIGIAEYIYSLFVCLASQEAVVHLEWNNPPLIGASSIFNELRTNEVG